MNSALQAQIDAHKARQQRFADAAARYQARKANEEAALIEQQRKADEEAALIEGKRKGTEQVKVKQRRDYDLASQRWRTIPIIWRILHAVSEEYDVSIGQIVGCSQKTKHVLPRFVAIGLMLQLTNMSLPAIGRRLGDRDHTTILNGRKRVAALLKEEAFRHRFERIKAGLQVPVHEYENIT